MTDLEERLNVPDPNLESVDLNLESVDQNLESVDLNLESARVDPEAAGSDPVFEDLLLFLKHNRGFDFTGYKRSSLMRRVRRRMLFVEVGSFEDYQDYLEVHPEEFELLFNTILINFTGFFRDADAWEYLASQVVPQILETLPAGAPVRVWSAGCASGEEAYSAAILFAEALGVEGFRERVKIYATDIDEAALAKARQATYSARALEGVSPSLRERYFERVDANFVFRNDLRRTLVFGRHDLMRDAPISRLDLLICRNTLIYFNRQSQKRIVANFHFAVKDTGFLFLGRAEMLLAQDNLFEAESVKHRVFCKASGNHHYRPLFPAVPLGAEASESPPSLPQLAELAMEVIPSAIVLIDPAGMVVYTNERAKRLLGLQPPDRGRPFRDLELSYRPVELRSIIDRALAARSTVRLQDVERVRENDTSLAFDIEVTPLESRDGTHLATSLAFTDVTQRQALRRELLQARQEVETANEELQSTNEELETSNEELQSTVEELQTTNEELQSTNEEMETVNEELQSANQELQSMNQELRTQTYEADKASVFLESILASVNVGIVVVDRDYTVLLWNERAEDMWGLRADEVRGRSLLGLDIGLPAQSLVEPLQRLWHQPGEAKQELLLNATNRRGYPVRMRVTMSVRQTMEFGPKGVVLVMEEEPR